MTRRPPRSPLFPYTPLSKSGGHRVIDRLPVHVHDQLDALRVLLDRLLARREDHVERADRRGIGVLDQPAGADRKSTRLNSSHSQISYAVFCLKKKRRDETLN